MTEKRKFMSNSNKDRSQEDYNDEPVSFCKNCLSLKIRFVPSMSDSNYCDECGSTDIETCHINEWEALYKERYGHNYLREH